MSRLSVCSLLDRQSCRHSGDQDPCQNPGKLQVVREEWCQCHVLEVLSLIGGRGEGKPV